MSQITPNFDASELECPCGCKTLPSLLAISRLQQLRDWYAKPMIINSGMRCEEHNKKVGGSKKSWHMKGMAFDIKAKTAQEKYQLAYLAMKLGWNGIIVYSSWLHIDLREKKYLGYGGK